MCVGQVAHADPGKAAIDMSLRRYATRLSAASLSPFGEFLLRFVRTMILSHLLSPGDLGAAVVLTSILTGCEVITDIGLDKFVMVSRDGARAQVVAAARQISIARAVLLAAAIALLAPLLASAFGASEHHRIVAWLGVVPLIRSLKN
ncbi:MAG: oligosaccharide flippase family protein, partial [Methylocella sp.]